ncbi:MAG: peptidylprolyl isomerase, partial [Nanoarchaeota archaeon]
MKIKKGDFIELDYIGRIKEDGRIFDLTSVEIAKKEGLYQEQQQYGPRVICVGEGQIVRAIDTYLEGKEMGTYTLSLVPDQAFGKKNAKLMKIVPITMFHKQKIRPFPGLQINMDGYMGIVKTVSGGRVIVDFNHPLAGRNVIYELIVKRVVTDVKEKIKAHLHTLFGKDIEFAIA